MFSTRKTLAFILALIFCLTAVSCGTANPAGEDTTAADTTTVNDETTAPDDDSPAPVYKELLPNPDTTVTEPSNPLKIYVTAGADESAADGSEEHPYASLEAARDAVRTLDKTGHDSVDVIVSGKFFRTVPFELTEEDSGTAECRIRYIGLEDSGITGGITVPNADLKPVTDAEYLSYFDDSVEGKILTVDLKNYGVNPEDTKFGELMSYPVFGMNTPFAGDTRLHVARYPDGKYLTLGNVTETEVDGNKAFDIKYTEIHNNHIENWHDTENVYAQGFFAVYWGASLTRVLGFDTENATMTLLHDGNSEPQKGMVYYWYNIPEELTEEGEYYLTEDAVLYYYPSEEDRDKDIYYPISRENLLTSAASYVTFENLTFEDTQQNVLSIEGDYVDFIGNKVQRIGYSVGSVKGMNNRILDCELSHIAVAGISITGGNEYDLVMSNCIAANNYVHNYSELMGTYCAAFNLNGCGITLRNNEICHSNHLAIGYFGNCHLIEYNEVYDVLNYTDDAGVTYCGRTYSCYGNVLRYNYFHDLGTPALEKNSTVGIYFDDGLSGQTAYGNIIENIYGFGILASGRDNTVRDNLLINAVSGIYYDQRYVDQKVAGVLGIKVFDAEKIIASHPRYAEAYPTLLEINDSGDINDGQYWAVPGGNQIYGNRCFVSESGIVEYSNMLPFEFSKKLLEFSYVEDNESVSYKDGEQPTVEEAIAQSGLDIPFDKIGRTSGN